MTISLDKFSQTTVLQQWHDATWQDYVALRDSSDIDWQKIVFHQGSLLADMGKEGPNHASFSDLMTAIFFVWAFLHPDVVLQSYGRCLIE
ncbi:MAG: Uma2 family endonuclease, partial [Symploca sp. SIO1B1]|nr:Uma2 family endonuclease [Symploca sp. SIO1B1]